MSGKFLSLEDAAKQLGISVDELNRLIDRKIIFPMRDGGTVKFKGDEVERVARELADEAADEDGLVLEPAAPGSASIVGSGPALGLGSALGSGSVVGSGLILESGLALDSGSSAGSAAIVGSGSQAGSGGGAAGDDDLVLGAAIEEPESVFQSAPAPTSGSRTIVSSQLEDPADDLSRLLSASGPLLPTETGGEDDLIVSGGAGGSFDDDLALDSIIGSSSPSLPGGAGSRKDPSELTGTDGGRTMAIDMSDVEDLGALLPPDDAPAGGSSPSVVDGTSGVFDSGVSLEADSLQASGIGLDDQTRAGMSGSLAGDAFDLGAASGDEESGSVVIGVEETGDSSFFTDDAGSGSVVFGEHPVGDQPQLSGILQPGGEMTVSMPFSVWQVVGLACCMLLMFMAACVMLDLTWKIRSPHGAPISTPLLRALAESFGWQ